MPTQKYVARTLAALVLFSLIIAACGSTPQTPSAAAPTAAPAAPADATAPTSAPAAAPAGTELTMWTWKVFHIPGLEAVAKNYEAKTGIKVNVSAFNPDEVYRTKVTTAAQSGDLPDVLAYWSTDQWEMAATDMLVELTDKVDTQWQGSFLPNTYDTKSRFPQAGSPSFDACQKDPNCTFKNIQVGQSFSVPLLAGQAYFVYGNKQLLTQAGLDPNVAPKTAEEWLTMMQTVKDKTGTAGLVTGTQNQDVLQFWLFNPLLMTSCGQETYDAIYNGKDSFANPCAMRVLNFIQSIATNELWMPGVLQTNIDPADVAFSQGKAAFDIGGTYTLGFLLSQGMKAEDIISFAIPPLAGSTYDSLQVSTFPLIDVMVTKNSQHPDQALDFIKFLTSKEQMEVFAKASGDLPAVKVDADPDKVGAVMVGLLSALSDKSPFDDSKAEQLEEPSLVLKVGLQQFITGETTAEKLAADVDAANKAAWATRGN